MASEALFIGAWTLALVGCAPNYVMPAATLDLRGRMDEAQALAIIRTSIRPPRNEGAGAYQVYLPEITYPIYPRLIGHTIAFDILGRRVPASRRPEPGCRIPSGELVAVADEVDSVCTVGFELDGISLVHIAATDGDANDMRLGGRLERGFIVFAHRSFTTGLVFNVSATRLAPLLAALTFFSPKARLVQGAGF